MNHVYFPHIPLQIGDHLPPLDATLIVGAGPSRWHALTVQPQREDQVESWLSRRGVYGFHPVLRHATRVRGKVREYDRRYVPGYVFARFPGVAVQHRVMLCPWVTGAICSEGGYWGVLDPSGLRAIHAMRKIEAAHAEARAAKLAARRRAAIVQVGDGAMFRAGPLAGLRGEVVELPTIGGALVRLQVFGREVDVAAQTDDLVPLCKAS